MESVTHRTLKRIAVGYLLGRRCAAAAPEVVAPVPRWRIDAAGYADASDETPATTTFMECKVSRADFLRDARRAAALFARRERLEAMLRRVEQEFVRVIEPHLRKEHALFEELERWDYGSSRLHAYRSLLREMVRVEKAIYGHTKFFFLARYRLATRLYIVAPRGLIEPVELPAGWGLLEWAPGGGAGEIGHAAMPMGAEVVDKDAGVDAGEEPMGDLASAEDLVERVPAPVHDCRPDRVQRTLRNIASSASRALHKRGRAGGKPAVRERLSPAALATGLLWEAGERA